MILIMLGPPGSGKGTQAKMLEQSLHLPHISTGDLLRDHIRRNTDLGKLAQSYMDKGNLVPDNLILDMLFERVSCKDCSKGYILDGFPRTIPQAEAFQKRLYRNNLKNREFGQEAPPILDSERVTIAEGQGASEDEEFGVRPTQPKADSSSCFGIEAKTSPIVINLELSDEKILERLTKRVVCESCGTSYHLIYSPPKEKGKCDKCAGTLIQRPDDTEEVIRKRLQVYSEQTAPLISFYSKKNLLHTIDCSSRQDEVFREISLVIEQTRKFC